SGPAPGHALQSARARPHPAGRFHPHRRGFGAPAEGPVTGPAARAGCVASATAGHVPVALARGGRYAPPHMARKPREQGPNAIARMRQPTTWPVMVALQAVVALFVASTFYSQRVAAELDDDALSIATNASPSIEALSQARGAMLKAEVAAARAIDVTADPADERDAAR